MADSQADINKRLFTMTTLSPRAKKIVSTGLYFLVIEKDDVDNESVQQELFLSLVEDMSEIGLYWACDNADIYATTYDLDLALSVLTYLMPNTLYPKLRNDAKLVSAIQSILDGNVSDNQIVEDYLSFLGGGDEQGPYVPDLTSAITFVAPNIRNTDMFATYLNALLSKLQAERKVSVNILTHKKEYQRIVDKTVTRLYTGLQYLCDKQIVSDQSFLLRRIQIFTKYLTQADKLEDWSFLFLTAPSTLNEDGLTIYKNRLTEFLGGTKLSIQYYLQRELTPSAMDIIGCVLFLFARSVHTPLFDKKCDELKSHLSPEHDISEIQDALGTYLDDLTRKNESVKDAE